MPIIYSTDQLQAMHRRLAEKHSLTDVIILKNSVMAYAFDSSARLIYRFLYPGQRAKNRINISAATVQSTVDTLLAAGKTVGVCDLDEAANEYAGRPLRLRG